MASKQVRKITSITANELVKVDMADRDGDGKKIKDTYATNAALTSAVNSANSGIDANSAAIASLGTRMTTAEGGISANASAISTEASTRATAVSNEATARANADTALGGRIDSVSAAVTAEATTRANADVALGGRIDNVSAAVTAEATARQADIDRIEAVARGRTHTFVIGDILNATTNDPYNALFMVDYNSVPVFTGLSGSDVTVLHNIKCDAGVLSGGRTLSEWLVFVPEGLTAVQLEDIRSAATTLLTNREVDLTGKTIDLVTIRLGDTIYIAKNDVPDRWYSGEASAGVDLRFSKLETQKPDFSNIEQAITNLQAANTTLTTRIATEETTRGNETSALQTAVNGHTTDIANINTALAGKQATLTFDTTPTANSTNPVTSGGIKTALDNLQSGLNLQSSVIGSVTISD